ncbi:MAG: T9SS type A sorting domain-containing protein [Crocinitomicaceae bacterium]|nr:T9SS type A sorting domain-containing protein [Crocinitomicaceae bacterium]
MKNSYLLLLLILGFFNLGLSQTYTTGVVTLSSTAGLGMTAKIDINTQVTLTLTGPSGRWFAVGFNASTMTAGTDVVGVHSSGPLSAFDCNLTGFAAPSTDAQQNWTISSDVVNAGVRTVVATRALNTGDANDYVFPETPSSIGLIWARSSSASFSYSYHGSTNRGITAANFTQVTPPAAPTGSASQTLCSGAILAQLNATGSEIQWYTTSIGGSPLPSNTALIDGTTYYASQTVNGLESTSRLAVIVTINSIPSAPIEINGEIDFCYSGTSQQYSISSVSGATSYVWTTPIGSTGSSTSTALNLLFTPGFQTGNLSVKSVNSCGQSANTMISINQHLPSAQTLNVSTCGPYSFNGQTLTQSGTYSYQGLTEWGCDSTIVLNLDYSTSFNQSISEEACGSYGWNGQTYFSSGIYVDTFPSVNGCDSIVSLDLTVHPIDAISLDSTVFDSFNWNGTVYTTSGTYTQFFTSSFGCDSSVTIALTIQNSGLEENTLDLKFYPNPVGFQKQVIVGNLLGSVDFKLRNVHGKTVQEGITFGTISILEALSSGIYYLEIEHQVYKVVLE